MANKSKGKAIEPGKLMAIELVNGGASFKLLSIEEAQRKYPKNEINLETGEWIHEGKVYYLGESCRRNSNVSMLLYTFNPLIVEQLSNALDLTWDIGFDPDGDD